jgi:hypothetical protein
MLYDICYVVAGVPVVALSSTVHDVCACSARTATGCVEWMHLALTGTQARAHAAVCARLLLLLLELRLCGAVAVHCASSMPRVYVYIICGVVVLS